MEHTNNYNLLYFRFTKGAPFLKSEASKLIEAYAIKLDDKILTQDEATELRTLAETNGLDEMPKDALQRITDLEAENKELKEMIAKLSEV